MKVLLQFLIAVPALQTKNFSINFGKANRKFSFSLHYNGGSSYLFVNRKDICESRADKKY